MAQRDLYFISGSPPCWTVMLALEVKGLAYNQKRLSNSGGEQKSAEFLAVNPRGHVPALIDGDVTVCQTLAILAYLDSLTPAPPLFGTEPWETARIWQSICDNDNHLRKPVNDLARPLFRGKAQEAAPQITATAAIVRDELVPLETRLTTGSWLAGDRLSAADLIAYPILMQLCRAAAREDATPLGLALYPFSAYFPSLDGWCRRMESLEGFENAYPPHWK
jgi:glutathione S-transferase